jgi:hypothetical protein
MSKSKKPPASPAVQLQSAIADPPNIRDEISGVEVVTETDAHGNKRRTARRLPRSTEDQAYFDKTQQIRQATLTAIERLSAIDPATAEEFYPLVQSYQSLMDTDLTKAAGKARSNMESDLATAGLSNSSSGAALRAALARNEMEARQGIAHQARLFAEEIKDRFIARQMGLHGLADEGIAQDEAKAQMGADRALGVQQSEIGHMTQRTAANNAAILGRHQLEVSAFNARKPGRTAQGLQAIGTIAGATLGGPIGGAMANRLLAPTPDPNARQWVNPNYR